MPIAVARSWRKPTRGAMRRFDTILFALSMRSLCTAPSKLTIKLWNLSVNTNLTKLGGSLQTLNINIKLWFVMRILTKKRRWPAFWKITKRASNSISTLWNRRRAALAVSDVPTAPSTAFALLISLQARSTVSGLFTFRRTCRPMVLNRLSIFGWVTGRQLRWKSRGWTFLMTRMVTDWCAAIISLTGPQSTLPVRSQEWRPSVLSILTWLLIDNTATSLKVLMPLELDAHTQISAPTRLIPPTSLFGAWSCAWKWQTSRGQALVMNRYASTSAEMWNVPRFWLFWTMAGLILIAPIISPTTLTSAI